MNHVTPEGIHAIRYMLMIFGLYASLLGLMVWFIYKLLKPNKKKNHKFRRNMNSLMWED